MKRIRDAAASFIEHGRALGRIELARIVIAEADKIASEATMPPKEFGVAKRSMAGELKRALLEPIIKDAELVANAHRAEAEALVVELEHDFAREHPGAVLAERISRTWAAARVAWRSR